MCHVKIYLLLTVDRGDLNLGTADDDPLRTMEPLLGTIDQDGKLLGSLPVFTNFGKNGEAPLNNRSAELTALLANRQNVVVKVSAR